MINAHGKGQIFTFDKETERKAGTLTMSIFSVCLFVSSIIIMGIAGIGLDLGGYLLSEMTSISIASGAIAEQMKIISACTTTALSIGYVLVLTYGVSALGQLLFAYALLPDGRLIKLKWKFRKVHVGKAHAVARGISKHIPTDRAVARQAVSGIYAFRDGLDMMHNPLVIASHLDGSTVNGNIICLPLDNVMLLKKTKKKLVIMADTLVKNKPKRKKFKIYWMYYDMDALCRLCERGCSVVNQ